MTTPTDQTGSADTTTIADLDSPAPKAKPAMPWTPILAAVVAAILSGLFTALLVSSNDQAAIRADFARQAGLPKPAVTVTVAPKPVPVARTYQFTPTDANVQTDGLNIINESDGVINVTDAGYFAIIVTGVHPTCTLTVDGDASAGITIASGPGWTSCAWSDRRH